MKYEIGQQVWWATCQTREHLETCPDCGGTGRLRVTFHDETQVSIDCANCSAGYNPPTGLVKWYGHMPEARLITVTGFEFTDGKASYHAGIGQGSYYRIEEGELFNAEDAAKAHADKLAEKHDASERARILNKEKDTRSWAWNASYHRNNIKRAQKDIAYHTAKLNVAAIRAKEPEVAIQAAE
jgi:hypothetical protein